MGMEIIFRFSWNLLPLVCETSFPLPLTKTRLKVIKHKDKEEKEKSGQEGEIDMGNNKNG